jgi:hypothetical protein
MPFLPSPPSFLGDLTAERRIQRFNTAQFIQAQSLTLALTPHREVSLPSGGVQIIAEIPREPQVFRLIPMSHTERPSRSITGTAGAGSGQQRRHAFTLLGTWDALMEPGDSWEDERGERWIIDEMVPHNGYETRGLVTAYGRTR